MPVLGWYCSPKGQLPIWDINFCATADFRFVLFGTGEDNSTPTKGVLFALPYESSDPWKSHSDVACVVLCGKIVEFENGETRGFARFINIVEVWNSGNMEIWKYGNMEVY